jgi:hypothetical protein
MGKQITILCFLAFYMSSALQVQGQTTAKKPVVKTKTTKSKSSSSTKTIGAPVTVKLTSKCEKDIMIYAGPKTNLRNPKQREIGGLSVNNLYLKTGDVVCIMDAKKKPKACMNITKATTTLQINPSGTAIVTP